MGGEKPAARDRRRSGSYSKHTVWLVWILVAVATTGGAQGQNVEVVGQIGGACYAVKVVGNYAYIGKGPNFRILDVSNPTSPRLRGSYDTPGDARGVFVSGSLAFVADDYGGLWIIDVSNPASPQVRGSYDTPGYAYGVFVCDSLAYVAADDGSLWILRYKRPAHAERWSDYH